METKTTALPSQTQQPIFGKVGGISELVHLSEEERLKYNISLDTYRTNLSVMKNERAEGRAEGLAEGRAEGRAEGLEEGIGIGERKSKMATARQMKADGLPMDMIQKYSGLTTEEIDAL